MNSRADEKARGKWLLLALAAPLAEYAGIGYMAVSLAVGAMLPLAALVRSDAQLSRGWNMLEWAWTGIVLGSLLPESGGYWPGEKSEIVVPLALLALAALSLGGEKSRRIGNTIFWMTAVPAALILFVLTGAVEPELLSPAPEQWEEYLLVVLLIPALTNANISTPKEKGKYLTGIGFAAVILAVLLQGGLSQTVAKGLEAPLYELGRCVGNGGFEIVISVVMTLCWYALGVLILDKGAEYGEKAGVGKKAAGIVPAAIAVAMVIPGLKMEGILLFGGSLVLWILVPVCFGKNKTKKDEKRC